MNMPIAQWVLYDQCNIDFIQPHVTDVFFIHFIGKKISSPVGNLKFNIKSKILEYAIAKNFLQECGDNNYNIHWIEAKNYKEGIELFYQKTNISHIISMRSSEEYLARKIEKYDLKEVILEIIPNHQFLIGADEFRKIFKKPPIMETFYRYMRKSRHILMTSDGDPEGGVWNYDHENRAFDSKHTKSWNWKPTNMEYINEAKLYFGYKNDDIIMPVTRQDALGLLDYFLENHFDLFGKLEDAMYSEDSKVHHSLLSTAMNFGLISPKEIIDKALKCNVNIASKEGFIRQIIGWREYMRQFYLFYYDSIYGENVLNHREKLSKNWWNYTKTNTKKELITTLNCVDSVIHRVKNENYSHHIERLMVIGNYTLLMGYDPLEVNKWFWEMYTDAFEWVVSPNVLGMSQYADGGKLATKPYISGGNYIDKMSNYCKGCQYSVKEKTCPMTHLYWDFVDRNQKIFATGRTPFIINSLKKIDIEKIRLAKQQFIKKINRLYEKN